MTWIEVGCMIGALVGTIWCYHWGLSHGRREVNPRRVLGRIIYHNVDLGFTETKVFVEIKELYFESELLVMVCEPVTQDVFVTHATVIDARGRLILKTKLPGIHVKCGETLNLNVPLVDL